MRFLLNETRSPLYPDSAREIISRALVATPKEFLSHCPLYKQTPLVKLESLACELGLQSLHIKDETDRLGLGSFKALGGCYAVARLVRSFVREHGSGQVPAGGLVSEPVKTIAGALTVCCASAGNHGLAVAAGARLFGCKCVVYLAQTVPEDFLARLQAKGAQVVRAGTTYEDSIEAATQASAENGWTLVSDAAWPGNEEIPALIMQGYLVMAEELADQAESSGGPPTHLFLQAGVGGLAASVAGYFHDRFAGLSPRIVIVEPKAAPCLTESAKRGELVHVAGEGSTRLGRLDCKDPSTLAFKVLRQSATAFMAIEDEDAFEAVRRLYAAGLHVGESGAAGLGGLMRLFGDDHAARKARDGLGLDGTSRVAAIASEGPADRELFAALTRHR